MSDEAKIEVTRMWLQKAFQDLQSANWLLLSPDALYIAVCFHCQQAAEKSLKAFLTWHDESFEKTRQEAKHAYTLAQQVWNFLIVKLTGETHPKKG